MQSFQKDTAGGNGKKDTGARVKELFARIKQCVAAGDFEKAEALREELMRVDTMALSEIIASAELIEEAKIAGIDQEHQLLWKELYERLSPEEKSILFYSLEEKIIPAKTVFIRQGWLSDRLFFIEQGRVDVIFTKAKENNLVLQVGKGGFVGDDTFFGMSICTSSVLSRSKVLVKILEKEKIAEWAEKAPGLYTKLESFCREFGQYEEAYERKRMEKSRFKRLTVHGQVCADILNSTMKQSGRKIKAAVGDISCGGACFFIKSSGKDAARALLARPLQMIFAIKGKNKLVEFAALGRVVKVRFHMENDYSVHVQFSKPLAQEKIEQVLGKC